MEVIQEDLKVVRSSNDKVRKSMFANHNELRRKYQELNERMEIIERNLCRGEGASAPEPEFTLQN